MLAGDAAHPCLQLHHALTWLIFRRARAHLVLHDLTLSDSLARLVLLVRHDVGGEDALLCLFPLELESSQRTEQLIHPPRRHVLALIDCGLLLIPAVHGCIHVSWHLVPLLVDLRALPPARAWHLL